MPWERYDPLGHALVVVPGSERLAQGAREQAEQAVPTTEAVLIVLVAEPGKTAAKYESPLSLVWRDAGVVLGYFSLVSESLGLSFCPLGMLGDVYVSPMSQDGRLHGAGAALLGANANNS